MNIKVMLKVKIFDKKGKVISCTEKESESWCRGYAALMLAQMRGSSTPSPTAPDTGNTNRALRTASNPFRCDAASGTVTSGIRVGTDNTTVDMTDYALNTAIANGSGAGQLNHGACVVSAPSINGSTSSFTVTRSITNASGGDITVEECGIYGQGYNGATRYFCMCRDITGSQVVPDGGGITVTYTVSVTV